MIDTEQDSSIWCVESRLNKRIFSKDEHAKKREKWLANIKVWQRANERTWAPFNGIENCKCVTKQKQRRSATEWLGSFRLRFCCFEFLLFFSLLFIQLYFPADSDTNIKHILLEHFRSHRAKVHVKIIEIVVCRIFLRRKENSDKCLLSFHLFLLLLQISKKKI